MHCGNKVGDPDDVGAASTATRGNMPPNACGSLVIKPSLLIVEQEFEWKSANLHGEKPQI
jgi:hypothetical protein